MKQPAVYIMASRRNGALYTGVTSDLVQRIYQHREALTPGFTSRYGCKLLVWYELRDDMAGAIAREKQIKGGSRRKKLALIESLNPDGAICTAICYKLSSRAERSDPGCPAGLDRFVASRLAMTGRIAPQNFPLASPSAHG